MTEVTMVDRLDRQAKERGSSPAVADPRGGKFDAWDTLTWREYAEKTHTLARAFMALGLERGQVVAIAGHNSVAWVLADLAAMAAGGMPAGVYGTLTPEGAQYIAKHSRAPIYVAADDQQAEKILAGKDELPHLRAIVLFPGQKSRLGSSLVLTWEEALARAAEVSAERLAEVRAKTQAKDAATLIYTSGTTGPPKAVMLSHENLMWTSAAAQVLVDPTPGDRGVSYLPLSHIAEQMLTIHVPITCGVTIHFVPAFEQLPDALRGVQPTTFLGVPRVWEKIQDKIESQLVSAPPRRVQIFRAAQKTGLAYHQATFEGRTPPLWARAVYPLFNRLVYSKLRERLGLTQLRAAASGAAPLSAATRDWFFGVGIPISEVYGQSEDTGPTTFNKDGQAKLDTVGRPVPGVEVKIAEDGEILVRGPNVFLGYLHDPASTAEAIDKEGWLHSGDIGEFTPDGYLRITDRKKDLIITAGGKNVAPQNIEKELRQIALVSQAVVIGDRQKFLTALLTLRPETVEAFLKSKGAGALEPGAAAQHPVVRAEIEREINQRVNPKLAQYETIKRFEILPQELSEEGGELTPTMKIKRKVVVQRFSERIERMYASD
ncbi:MAG: long-chain fatty acid--CoA ligase [Myxococcota bacterium]